jgi:hypothetical protein
MELLKLLDWLAFNPTSERVGMKKKRFTVERIVGSWLESLRGRIHDNWIR